MPASKPEFTTPSKRVQVNTPWARYLWTAVHFSSSLLLSSVGSTYGEKWQRGSLLHRRCFRGPAGGGLAKLQVPRGQRAEGQWPGWRWFPSAALRGGTVLRAVPWFLLAAQTRSPSSAGHLRSLLFCEEYQERCGFPPNSIALLVNRHPLLSNSSRGCCRGASELKETASWWQLG